MGITHHAAKVAILGDYPPRKCGIATFTRDLRDAVAGLKPDWQAPVLTVTDPGNHYEYPPEVRFEINEQEVPSYLRAAEFLNLSHADLLCVQHEFGIFGGPAGSHILALLRRAKMPSVVTLHTVLANPDEGQRQAFGELMDCASKLVVMTARGASMLREIYGVRDGKISVIPHGIPDIPFVDPNFYKDQFGVAGRSVLLTFGLLSPGKGIEYAIQAMPAIVRQNPGCVYIVLGATHPNLLRQNGESYRLSLERLAKELGVEQNVKFVNRYVDHRELCEFIGAADIYVTPYLNEAQITSGTLAYCFGAGKAVVSTPYWHATELLADERGVIVPFRNGEAIAESVNGLLDHEAGRHAMRKQAYMMGREMVWDRVAQAYANVLDEARQLYQTNGRHPKPVSNGSKERRGLPEWKFDHLLRMSDSTGIFQHAIFTIPRFQDGYCTDDNARALLLTAQLEELGEGISECQGLQFSAAAFLENAFVADSGRFRNFMEFRRHWIEETGSEDSHGRALWALGAIVGRSSNVGLRAWAANLFERALPVVSGFTSPRAWAFALLGLHEYFRTLHGDLLASRLREELAGKLFTLFQRNAVDGWGWAEDILAYDNPRLPQALILAGRWMQNESMRQTGLEALRWLMQHQKGGAGVFRPIGSNGFWRRGSEGAIFDQQPIEAAAAVGACMEALHATGDDFWKQEAERAFEWFLGANDLRLSIYDPSTGGCRDGLHEHRVNENQGAESTLSFLLARAEIQQLHRFSQKISLS